MMHNDPLGEETARRENDRYGNAPLRRGPDPDKIAKHLATGEDSLVTRKAPDGFAHESPIRAFTEFKVEGIMAIGKGFRPSLAHLAAYLNAMDVKEGWQFVQIILPDNDAGDPTIVFRRSVQDIYQRMASDIGKRVERHIGKSPALAAPYGGDPTNPDHYGGRACADIGERLSANGYQILKYVWRLGRKDEAVVELGKAIWYAKSEEALIPMVGKRNLVSPDLGGIKPEHRQSFLEDRINDQPAFTQIIARMLWSGYTCRKMQAIRESIEEHKRSLESSNA